MLINYGVSWQQDTMFVQYTRTLLLLPSMIKATVKNVLLTKNCFQNSDIPVESETMEGFNLYQNYDPLCYNTSVWDI